MVAIAMAWDMYVVQSQNLLHLSKSVFVSFWKIEELVTRELTELRYTNSLYLN